VMKLFPTPLHGLHYVESSSYRDLRGAFARLFCADDLESLLGQRHIVHINHSHTMKSGAIRGMHYQLHPYSEMKFVRCLKGKVWDVALDLRTGSKTFLQWFGIELTPDNERMMVIPEGFAHGFQTLEPNSELLYLHTAPYMPSHEGGVRYDDPRVSIKWPMSVSDISSRDSQHVLLGDHFMGITA
jgi:dTDP-4-dehydrorhamnose 3,5-epimerase